MIGKRTFGWGYRGILFLGTFALVVYLLIASRIWSADLNRYFIRTGKWPELVFVLLLVYIITTILEKLLFWEYRLQTRRS